MKIESLDSLLDDELSWRKHEISSLHEIAVNINLDTQDDNEKVLYKTVMKTLFLLLYSHWEGFIKKTCKIYLKYINEDKVVSSELTKNFTALMLKKFITTCSGDESKNSLSISDYLNFVEQHEDKLSKKFKVDVKVDQDFDDGFIQTFSNLSYKNYKNIIQSLNLPFYDFFENQKKDVIDISGKTQNVAYLSSILDFNLLFYRNSIAHGGTSVSDLSLDIYTPLEEKILFIMNQHKKDIQEYCGKKLYKKINKIEHDEYIKSNNEYVKNFFINIENQVNVADFEDENEPEGLSCNNPNELIA